MCLPGAHSCVTSHLLPLTTVRPQAQGARCPHTQAATLPPCANDLPHTAFTVSPSDPLKRIKTLKGRERLSLVSSRSTSHSSASDTGSKGEATGLHPPPSLALTALNHSSHLYVPGFSELQGSPVWQALAGHKRRIPLAVVLPRPARGAGTLIPSAQHFVWAAKQPLGNAALGALFA